MKLPRRFAQGPIGSAPDPGLVAAASSGNLVSNVANKAQEVYKAYSETKQRAEFTNQFHAAQSEVGAMLHNWNKKVDESGRFMVNEQGEEVPTHEILLSSFDSFAAENVRSNLNRFTQGLNQDNALRIQDRIEGLITSERNRLQSKERQLYVNHQAAQLNDSVSMYVNRGDYQNAAQAISDADQAGIITPDQKASRLSALQSDFVDSLEPLYDEVSRTAENGEYERFIEISADISSRIQDAVEDNVNPLAQETADELIENLNRRTSIGVIINNFDTVEDKAQFVLDFNENRPEGMSIDDHQKLTSTMSTMLERSKRAELVANAEENAAAERERGRAASNLSIRTYRGETGLTEIDAAADAGIITEAQRVTLHREVYRQDAERESIFANNQMVQYAMENGIALDSSNKDHRTAVSGYYDGLISDGLDPLSDEGSALTAYFVEQTGIVPDSFKSTVRTGLRSGSPEVAAQVSNAFMQIQENAPALVDQFSASEKAQAMMIGEMVSAGTDPVQAVELARSRSNISQGEREILSNQYRDEAKENTKKLDEFIDDDFDTIFSWQPDTEIALESEFNILSEQYYFQTQNIDQARKLAWNDLTRVWGVSEISGSREMVKYPPEYVGGTREGFEADTAGLEGTIVPIADQVTARNGGRSFALVRELDNGLSEPVVNDAGQLARWTPEPPEQEDYSSLVNQAERKRALLRLFDGAGEVTPEMIAEMENDLGR